MVYFSLHTGLFIQGPQPRVLLMYLLLGMPLRGQFRTHTGLACASGSTDKEVEMNCCGVKCVLDQLYVWQISVSKDASCIFLGLNSQHICGLSFSYKMPSGCITFKIVIRE